MHLSYPMIVGAEMRESLFFFQIQWVKFRHLDVKHLNDSGFKYHKNAVTSPSLLQELLLSTEPAAQTERSFCFGL